MFQGFLIDLDGTLLRSDSDSFLPAYLQLVGDSLAELAPAEHVVGVLVRSTQEMLKNNDPTRTLKDVFDGFFYPHLETSEEKLRPWLEKFYRDEYPSLQPLSEPSEGAVALVEQVTDINLDIALATSPLFPLTAVDQRLQWAGFDPPSQVFSLIASYEDFHFSKPHPAYFMELLGRLGYSSEQVVMIGNDYESDVLPATELGIPSFLVGNHENSAVPSGDLSSVWHWLQNGASNQHKQEANQAPATILAQLRGYLAALLSQVRVVEPGLWARRPEPGAWSPIEIVSHLRDVEREVNQPRIEMITEQDLPFLQAMNPDEWAEERGYLNFSPSDVLTELSTARLETLSKLDRLDEQAWQRKAKHAIFGPTNLAEVLHVAMQHELLHLAQLRATLTELGSFA